MFYNDLLTERERERERERASKIDLDAIDILENLEYRHENFVPFLHIFYVRRCKLRDALMRNMLKTIIYCILCIVIVKHYY